MSATTISLFDCFSSVPDPRSSLGRRHPLGAILTLCSVAMLCGCRSLYAIAQFGRDRGKHFAGVLGFTRQTTPCCTTRCTTCSSPWTRARSRRPWRGGPPRRPRRTAGRPSASTARRCGARPTCNCPGVHLLAAYAHEAGIVLRQLPVDAKTNEHKAALALLDLIPVNGKLFVGDAMFCQRDLSRNQG